MKLEAVNPLLPEEVCVATITAVRGSYLWLQLEGEFQFSEEPSLLFLLTPVMCLVKLNRLAK